MKWDWRLWERSNRIIVDGRTPISTHWSVSAYMGNILKYSPIVSNLSSKSDMILCKLDINALKDFNVLSLKDLKFPNISGYLRAEVIAEIKKIPKFSAIIKRKVVWFCPFQFLSYHLRVILCSKICLRTNLELWLSEIKIGPCVHEKNDIGKTPEGINGEQESGWEIVQFIVKLLLGSQRTDGKTDSE